MRAEMIELFMKSLTAPKNYGPYADADTRADVAAFLLRRYGEDKETLQKVMIAIKEACPLRFGPPDVATAKKAIEDYEKEYCTAIRYSPPPREYPPATIEDREEGIIDLKAKADAIGIDTQKDGWVAAYFFARMAQNTG